MKKMMKTLFLALFAALLIPTSAFASSDASLLGPGEWDPVGAQSFDITAYENYSTYYITSADGGNFKLVVNSDRLSNVFTASMAVDGVYRGDTVSKSYHNGTVTIEFSNIPVGAMLRFEIMMAYDDSIVVEFWD